MNRSVANIIRFFMDECIPPAIRDNRFFMYPFFYIAYRGKNLETAMNFKRLIYSMTEEDYINFYDNLNTISRNRITDLNEACIKFMIKNIRDTSNTSILDVGCGKGYFLSRVMVEVPQISATGCDIVNKGKNAEYTFVKGSVESLPFLDNEFDVVTCSHTIEHVTDMKASISEIKRVARKKIIIVVPCQRYFYYTLDEHINFFQFEEKLTSIVGLENYKCEKIWGDWVYIGELEK